MTKHAPSAPACYPMDLSPLLGIILQMYGSQLEFQWIMLENGSASSQMHTAVEEAPPPAPPALPHVALPSTGLSVQSEDLEGPHLCPILLLPLSHTSQVMSPVLSCFPFAMADGC